ncbi:MAG TPA: Stp1/IreP family PP2C-type Ser/Thr phosphatase [Candidatus Nitrosotalea sp.]|nr:Stp1/IreP family PP2C-type Ser/Thr phosphatase [Candidatus Nitrosotalea sp.]
MKLTTHAAGKTDIGVVRKNNEDNFGYDIRAGIFVVCDGMGGQAAGEVASKIAVDTVLGYFHQQEKRRDSEVLGREFGEVSESANALANAIQLANKAIRAASAQEATSAGMGCTIVAVRVEDELFSIAHVGDSRIYLIRGGGIQQLTTDHSLVMEQVRRGMITLEEAEHFEMQNVIVRALGSEDSVEPDLADLTLEEHDTLLLCSDGLSRYVKDAAMLELINNAKTLDDACDALIEAAKSGGSDDNITCLLIRAVEQTWGGRLFRRSGDKAQSST